MSHLTQSREKRLALKSRSILLIEEDPHTRQLWKDICRSLDVGQLTLASSPSDAIQELQKQRKDLVICGRSKPPLDAPRLVLCVRASSDASIRQTPIVVVKDNATPSAVVEARDVGANEILTPPLSIEAILRVFESVFLKPRKFVDAGGFHGPDRRRRTGFAGEDRRRSEAAAKPDQ